MNIEVHDTAFMVAYYRAQHEQLSKDSFAKLWLRPTVKKWALSFFENVSYEDEILHCMRNRYFHDQLHEIASKNEEVLFINMGAGFSMYPYELPKNIITIEIDLPTIYAYKKQKIDTFMAEQKLPERNVLHIAGDITDPENKKQLEGFVNGFGAKKTVILIEGVFFFLTRSQIDYIMKMCRDVLKKDDLLFCVSYDDEITKTPVFKKLTTYFSEFLKSEGNPFTVLPHSYYNSASGFNLKDRFSSLELAKKLKCIDPLIAENEVLNEYFYMLQKV